MDLRKYLEEFINVECACGKSHQIILPNVVTGEGAIEKIPEILRKAGVLEEIF